jgi:hypothetical protein
MKTGGGGFQKNSKKNQSHKRAMTAPLHRRGVSHSEKVGGGFALGLDMGRLHLLQFNDAQIRFGF